MASAAAPKQRQTFELIYIECIRRGWGNSPIWFRRQITAMAMLTFCTLMRGAETVSLSRDGIVWVKKGGAVIMDSSFVPEIDQRGELYGSDAEDGGKRFDILGLLVCVPSRKNKQHIPSWIPVMDKATLRVLARHVAFLDRSFPEGDPLFIARQSKRVKFSPDRAMPVSDFRNQLREALIACCGLTTQQAKQFGAHSLRIGVTTHLARRGVSAELRQQLGEWMSRETSLRYLQLAPQAQFEVLSRM